MNNNGGASGSGGAVATADNTNNAVAISIESDDNDSSTAEQDRLIGGSTGGNSNMGIDRRDLDGILASRSGSMRSHGNIFSSILARQRSYTPISSTSSPSGRSGGAPLSRRLQTSRSVSGTAGVGASSTGGSAGGSLEDPTAGGATGGNVRQLGFWRMNINDVLSLSTAPSTEALRSFISHSNFRYQPGGSGTSATSPIAQPSSGDFAHSLSQNQHQDSNASSTSAALRLNQRISGGGGGGIVNAGGTNVIGRSVSMLEGGLQQPHHMALRHNASVTDLPTQAANNTFDNSLQGRGGGGGGGVPAPGGATSGNGSEDGGANGGQPTEHNDDDENAISDMLVNVLSHFVRYLPVIFLLLLKFIHDHLLGILDVAVLLMVTINVNKSIRTEVAKLAQKNYAVLIRDACLLVLVVTVRLFLATVPPDPFGLIVPPPKRAFTLQVATLAYHTEGSSSSTSSDPIVGQVTVAPSAISPSSDSVQATITNDSYDAVKVIPLGMLLYYVAVSDLILKLLTMLIKVGITMLPTHIIRLKVRARLYVLVEFASQFYRALAPITQWFLFLYVSYSGLEVISGGLFSSFYLGVKVVELLERGKSLKKAVVTFRRNIESERPPTKDELDAAGTVCPICHDAYTAPIILECSHIFCDECVSTWFKREQTCPMCRAKVSDDPTWQDGATTFFLQLF